MYAGSTRRATGALLPAASLAFALLVGGCQKDTDPGPGGVTVGEARALDEAAEMLEKRPAPPLADATVPAEIVPAEIAPAAAVTSSAPKPAATPKPKPKP